MNAMPDPTGGPAALTHGAAPQAGWCLRFLSGALRGRTMLLRPGANVVGSAGECEVMLPGGNVQPRHLVITVGELVVSMQRVGTAVARVNGEEVHPQRRSVVAGDVIGLGDIEVQLDRSYPASAEGDRMFATGTDTPPAAGATVAARVPDGPRRHRVAAATLAGLALLGFMALAWHEARPSGGPAGAAAVTLDAVERALDGYAEVEVVAGAGGQFTLRGYVESPARKAALQDAMRPFGPAVVVNVHATQDMVEQARRFIGDPGVSVGYAGKGRLVVSGTVDDEAVRLKIRRLSEDLHPTVLVTDRVQYQEKRKPAADETSAQWAAWQKILPARMVGITDDGNGLRHIQLSNGSRYYEGSVLRSGAELKRIDADSLVLSGGNEAADTSPD